MVGCILEQQLFNDIFAKKNIITYLLDCQMVNFSLLKLEERACELDQWLYKKPSPEKNIDFTRFIQEKDQ